MYVEISLPQQTSKSSCDVANRFVLLTPYITKVNCMLNPTALTEHSTQLQAIAQTIDGCQKCILGSNVTHYVPGMGTESAEIVFVGEGPGAREDALGLPFVGASGKFLDTLLAHIGLSRSEIFITNVVKCRPPGNRDPLAEEIEACDGYLEGQLAIIQPKIIVTLGRFSLAKFLPGTKISEVHGQPKRRKDGRIIFPSYHPAVALYTPSMREVLTKDFVRLGALLQQLTNSSS